MSHVGIWPLVSLYSEPRDPVRERERESERERERGRIFFSDKLKLVEL